MTRIFIQVLGLLVAASGAMACDDSGVPWVEIEGDDFGAQLGWPTRPGATYSVYRSTDEWEEFWTGVPPDPRFDISDPGAVRVAEGLTEGAFHDYFPLFLGDPFYPSGAFYRVVEHTAMGDFPSEPVGRIPRRIWHTTPYEPEPLADNKLAVCLDPTPDDTLRRQLLDHDVVSITWWDPTTQGYGHDVPPFASVLDMEMGAVFSVRPSARFGDHGKTWYFHQLTGRVPTSAELVTGVYEGHNAVTWPVTAAATTASAVLDGPGHMQHATAVGVWSPGTRTVYWYPQIPPTDLPGIDEIMSGDFEIAPCSAIYVYIDAGHPEGTELGDLIGLTWPPPLADAP